MFVLGSLSLATPRPPQDRPRPPKTTPRPPQDHPRSHATRMRSKVFAKNERHAAWERSCRSRPPKTTQETKMKIFHQKCWFFIGKVYVWSQKGRFTLRFQARIGDCLKKCPFSVGNMCKSARRTHGTAMRSAPVAEVVASEARHTFP